MIFNRNVPKKKRPKRSDAAENKDIIREVLITLESENLKMTIANIAKRAGLSRKTVSKHLRENFPASKITRQRTGRATTKIRRE